MRFFLFCFVAIAGLSQVASAAAISSTLYGARADGKPGEAFGFYNSGTQSGNSSGTFGTIDPQGGPPNNNQGIANFVSGSLEFTPGNRGFISTAVRRNGYSFFSTTYAFFDPNFSATVIDPMVQNNAYWEFAVNGIFNYNITGQAPQISGNIRTYRFEKVGGSILGQDADGTAQTTRQGQIASGVYRLYYDHRNFSPRVSGPINNSTGGTNLDIIFTFQGEDPNVVPEPASVAVFGLLALGVAARRRLKK